MERRGGRDAAHPGVGLSYLPSVFSMAACCHKPDCPKQGGVPSALQLSGKMVHKGEGMLQVSNTGFLSGATRAHNGV